MFIGICFLQCSPKNKRTEERSFVKNTNILGKQDSQVKNINYKVGLTFIEGYVSNSNKMREAVGIRDYISSDSLVTEDFKNKLNTILDDAYDREPDYGLGFDPIFDGQDYPNTFEIAYIDSTSNYITLRGVNWDAYEVVLKIEFEDGKSLVDGCGIVNIPKEKQAKRE